MKVILKKLYAKFPLRNFFEQPLLHRKEESLNMKNEHVQLQKLRNKFEEMFKKLYLTFFLRNFFKQPLLHRRE